MRKYLTPFIWCFVACFCTHLFEHLRAQSAQTLDGVRVGAGGLQIAEALAQRLGVGGARVGKHLLRQHHSKSLVAGRPRLAS